jgi:O-methyltransferase
VGTSPLHAVIIIDSSLHDHSRSSPESPRTTLMVDVGSLYIDLIKRCLTNSIYPDSEKLVLRPDKPIKRALINLLTRSGLQVVRPMSAGARLEGRSWPQYAHTMIGQARLDNIEKCVEQVLEDGVPGDLIETGVWRGGSTILMRAILKARGDVTRRVWVADSFAGLPAPNVERYPADAGLTFHLADHLAVSLDEVKSNFGRYGLLDDQVVFLKGWFSETLPTAPIESLAVMRLDGDLYESTMDALVNLYPKLSSGGFVIVDDYADIPACKQAVDDFRSQHRIRDEIVPIDWTGVYWRRSS